MEEIKQVIDKYLQEKDTDYAIMITGEWGCGKTYYVNNALKNYLGKKKCCVDNADEYLNLCI